MPSTISAISKFAADTFSTTTLSSVPTRNWISTEAKIIEYSLFSDDDPRLLEFVFDALGSLKYYNKKFVNNKELCQIMIHRNEYRLTLCKNLLDGLHCIFECIIDWCQFSFLDEPIHLISSMARKHYRL